MKRKQKKIKSKAIRMILTVSLPAILLLGGVCGWVIAGMKKNTVDSITSLNRLALQKSTAALREQKMTELQTLAENKSSLADSSLELILHQTRLVAMAGEDVFTGLADCQISEADLHAPQLYTYDFAGAQPERMGGYSIHIRAPRELMEESSIREQNGVITGARLNLNSLIDGQAEDKAKKYQKLREYYLAAGLRETLGGIRNFDNGDGTYRGIGASYFCLESSGIDILADTLTAPQIEYDARNSAWYREAKKLKQGEVFWSDPVLDGSGRGVALICAMPVYVGDELIGVAGSGGLIDNIRELVQNTTIGENGYAFLVNREQDGVMNLVAGIRPENDDASGGMMGQELTRCAENLLATENKELEAVLCEIAERREGIRRIRLDGQEVFIAYAPLFVTSWTMVTVIGTNDLSIAGPMDALEKQMSGIAQTAMEQTNLKMMLTALLFAVVILVVILLTVLFSCRFSDRLAKPIVELTEAAGAISGGNLDRKTEVCTGDEIQELGEAFNRMTDSLKAYLKNLSAVTAEKERIGAELNVATQIQAGMLPRIFPPFPAQKEFDIYATMQPAKEVGGDFYDFFMTDEEHLAVVIADVSGKGVPAALFMVIAKTLIKNDAQEGHQPGEVFATVNNRLCENNEAGMFVTGWMGILNLHTGELTYANAGHNPPLVKKAEGEFTYVRAQPGFVLGAMPNIAYAQGTIRLETEELLYLYTDGVTEAMDSAGCLYGEERLRRILNGSAKLPLAAALLAVKRDIDIFTQPEAQSDDITMLLLRKNKCAYGTDGAKEVP